VLRTSVANIVNNKACVDVSVRIFGSNKRFVSPDVCCVSGAVCGVTAITGTTCFTCCN
jgi:hypothetical protein